ncbi:MAG: tetratricopeptide repeat protein [Planctomycetota bacterium]|nr:tetratricopeptide repeat protein [Planctomycetota bacterium]
MFSLWRDAVEQRQLAEKNAGLQLLQRDQAVKDRDRAEALQKQAERERERAEKETARAERERERAEENATEAARQTAAAAANLKAAESRFAQAQSAVAELFQLGNHLLRVPNMEARGKSALDRAMQFKQSLLAEKSDDPGVQFGTAQAVLQMAWAQLELGLHEESEQSYRSAIDLFQRVRASQGDTLEVLRELRSAHIFLGVALSNQAKWREAEVIARESARLARQVIENPSHVTFDRLVLGNALMNLSQSLLANGLADEARSALEDAVRIQREVFAIFPNKNHAAAELSLALGGLAGCVAKTDRAAALELANEALQLRRSQIEATSNPRDEAMYFARVCLQVASLYSDLKRPEDALRVLEEALRHVEPASLKYRAYRGLRFAHVHCLTQMQAIMLGRKNQTEADRLQRELEVQLRGILEVMPGDVEGRSRLATILGTESRRLVAERDFDAAWDRAVEAMRLYVELHVEVEPALTWVRQVRTSTSRVLAIPPRFEREKEKLQVARDFLRLLPDDANACNSLAWHLLMAHDPAVLNSAEGLKLAQRAVELDSTQPFFLNTLGLGYLLNGDLDAAQNAFEKSLEIKTRVPAADWYYLAIIHWRRCSTKRRKAASRPILATKNCSISNGPPGGNSGCLPNRWNLAIAPGSPMKWGHPQMSTDGPSRCVVGIPNPHP